MPKNYKSYITCFIALLSFSLVIGQSEVEYKDVMLDGKPAKLNIITGEITLVNLKQDKTMPNALIQKTDSINTVKSVSNHTTTNYHIVKKDETLLGISRLYNISLTELKALNNLETTLISEGKKLKIKNEEGITDVLKVEKDTFKSTKKISFHIVKKEETLYSLSKRYAMTVKELKAVNNLESNRIKVGQKLQVNSFDNNQTKNPTIWTVKKGDTLYNIAIRNNITVEKLKRLNGLSGNLIKVGQKLEIK